jgi:hypothetical protein
MRSGAECDVAHYGATLLSWCDVAQMVRRCSYGATLLLWCDVALMVRRCSVGRALACCKAGPSSILGSAPQGGFPTELTSDEDMEISLGEWRRINVLYECD